MRIRYKGEAFIPQTFFEIKLQLNPNTKFLMLFNDLHFFTNRFQVTKAEGVVFSWAFQKMAWDDADQSVDYSNQYELAGDTAIIYSVNVTNTIDGGATQCKTCPRGANLNGYVCAFR